MSQTYDEIDVLHTVQPAQIEEFAKAIPPVQLPRISIEEVNLSIPKDIHSEIGRPNTENNLETIASEPPGFGSWGADGVFWYPDSKFYPSNSLGKIVTSMGVSSGAMIGPNLILTAGHCVHPGQTGSLDDLYQNIAFQPGYPAEGIWYAVKKVFVHRNWVKRGAFYNDFAICVTEQIMHVPDYWGIRTNADHSKYGCWIYGYPAEGRFNGEKAVTDQGNTSVEPWRNGSLQFNVVGIDTIDMTPGSSGGPWIPRDRLNEGNIILPGLDTKWKRPYQINGINSFMFNEFPGIMISPFFGREAEGFFREVLSNLPRKLD